MVRPNFLLQSGFLPSLKKETNLLRTIKHLNFHHEKKSIEFYATNFISNKNYTFQSSHMKSLSRPFSTCINGIFNRNRNPLPVNKTGKWDSLKEQMEYKIFSIFSFEFVNKNNSMNRKNRMNSLQKRFYSGTNANDDEESSTIQRHMNVHKHPINDIPTEKLLESVLQDRLKEENVRDFQMKHPDIYGKIAREAIERVKKDKTISLEDALKEKITYEMQKDAYRKDNRTSYISSRSKDLSRMDSYKPKDSVPKKDEYRYKKSVEKPRAYTVKRPVE